MAVATMRPLDRRRSLGSLSGLLGVCPHRLLFADIEDFISLASTTVMTSFFLFLLLMVVPLLLVILVFPIPILRVPVGMSAGPLLAGATWFATRSSLSYDNLLA